jgi:hypothetical protein
VSARVSQLLEREKQLQARCDAQRTSITREIDGIEERVARFDRVAGMARNAVLHPAVIAGGIVVLLTIGKLRGMRLVGRVFLLATAARRLVRTVRMFDSVSARRRSRVSGSQR